MVNVNLVQGSTTNPKAKPAAGGCSNRNKTIKNMANAMPIAAVTS